MIACAMLADLRFGCLGEHVSPHATLSAIEDRSLLSILQTEVATPSKHCLSPLCKLLACPATLDQSPSLAIQMAALSVLPLLALVQLFLRLLLLLAVLALLAEPLWSEMVASPSSRCFPSAACERRVLCRPPLIRKRASLP